MERYRNNIQDQFGNAISSVTVTVRLESSGALATIYSDNSLSAKSNPFTNDGDGEFFFYAADERYDIFFTGPITDQIDDVLLQDSQAFGPTVKIFTDINTATPPTTEAVNGRLEIWDLAGNDQLARLGYVNSNELQLRNQMRGGAIQMRGIDVGGSTRLLFGGDPDGAASLYYIGDEKIRTSTGGLNIAGSIATATPPTTESVDTRLIFFDGDFNDTLGFVGFNGSATMVLRSTMHGGVVRVQGEDAGGTARTILEGDPDSATSIYFNGNKRLGTAGTGQVSLFSTGSTSTEDRRIIFRYQDSTAAGSVGYVSGADLRLRNSIHGGGIVLEAEDAGGTLRTILTADPDASTVLRGDTTLELEVGPAGDNAIFAVVTGAVSLYYNNQVNLRTSAESGNDIGMGAEVRHNDDAFYPVGMNVLPEDAGLDSGTVSLLNVNVGKMLTYNTATARSLTIAEAGSVKVGATWALLVGPSAGVLTGNCTGSMQIRWWNGTGWTTTAAAGNITIGVGQYTIWKETDTLYWISGPTLS